MFYKQKCRFKINFSFGLILRNRIDGNFRYWHASNGVERILDHSLLISQFSDFEIFLNKVFELDMLEIFLVQSVFEMLKLYALLLFLQTSLRNTQLVAG